MKKTKSLLFILIIFLIMFGCSLPTDSGNTKANATEITKLGEWINFETATDVYFFLNVKEDEKYKLYWEKLSGSLSLNIEYLENGEWEERSYYKPKREGEPLGLKAYEDSNIYFNFSTYRESTGRFKLEKFTNLDVPTNLSVTEVNGILEISWDELYGVGGYELYKSTDAINYEQIKSIDNRNQTSFQDNDTSIGQIYYYQIKSIVSPFESKLSTAISGALSFSNFTAPLPSVTNIYRDITISWENLTWAEGYRIYRSDDISGAYTQIGTDFTSDKLEYLDSDENLSFESEYYYKLSVLYEGSESTLSDAVVGIKREFEPDFYENDDSKYYSYGMLMKESKVYEQMHTLDGEDFGSRYAAGGGDFYSVCLDYGFYMAIRVTFTELNLNGNSSISLVGDLGSATITDVGDTFISPYIYSVTDIYYFKIFMNEETDGKNSVSYTIKVDLVAP